MFYHAFSTWPGLSEWALILIARFIPQVKPETLSLKIRTERKVPKLGLMLVGWGGNNGSTLTAALEANRRQLEWRTKTGVQKANWYGSITQASTVLLGSDANGSDVYIPMNKIVPMVDPNDIGEWWWFWRLGIVRW